MTVSEYATLDLDNISLSRLVEILSRIRIRGCGVEHWEASDSTNGFHVTISCRCGGCRLVWDDADRFSKDQSRPVYARDVLFGRRGRKLWLNQKGKDVSGLNSEAASSISGSVVDPPYPGDNSHGY